nr:DUF1107 domain-containing protein [uncultured Tolumonas sp.]
MKRSFREHQALQIARYIRSYYQGTFYIEQSGPFHFDAGRACYDDVENVRWKKVLAQINKEIRNLSSLKTMITN